jgi:hypothetical protein
MLSHLSRVLQVVTLAALVTVAAASPAPAGAAPAATDPAKLSSAAAVVRYLEANGVKCSKLRATGSDRHGGKYSQCSTTSGTVTLRVYPSVAAHEQARHANTAVWAVAHCKSKQKRTPLHGITYGLWRLETTSTAVKYAVAKALALKQDWKNNKGHDRLSCG